MTRSSRFYAPHSASAKLDLAVDLDGTLIKTDSLDEGFVRQLFSNPIAAVLSLVNLGRGRAAFKAGLAEQSAAGAASFPERSEFVAWLAAESKSGRRIHLVTAAHRIVAEAVAARYGIFQSIVATDGTTNLKGALKRDRLVELFPKGFSYAGDSVADLPVFEAAGSIVLVGHSPGLARQARRRGHTVEAEFPRGRPTIRQWGRAFRIHQWAKNVLIFIPLMLSGAFLHASSTLTVMLGFLALGVTASGTYLLNDLSDLSADRNHATKVKRPFASGELSIRAGFGVSGALMTVGFITAFMLSWKFGLLILGYIGLTVSYSMWLKRRVIVDVTVLASLYALRIAMGAVLARASLSEWLLVYALFFFLSLSLAKRYVEIVKGAAKPGAILGRGYTTTDGLFTLTMGIAAAMTSLLVMVMFLVFVAMLPNTYAHPKFLWAAPMLVYLWTARVWLFASRGQLEDDPVLFAVKDRTSLLLGAILGLFTLMAVLPFPLFGTQPQAHISPAEASNGK